MGMTSQFRAMEVAFPMVDLDVKPDATWLVDMVTRADWGQPFRIVEAAQQSKLKLNHKGALQKSGFAATGMLESMSPSVEIDQPFLYWSMRDGLPIPLYTAWIDYADMTLVV